MASSKRVRLTDPRRRQRRAVEDNIPYPGNLNQPDRKFKRMDQYSNYEETLNHPIPDMRHEWQDNPRDEIGFGIPRAAMVASVRMAATKAVRLAVFLLGEKAPRGIIQAQAQDFMRLGNRGLDMAMKRFLSTEKLYREAEDDEESKEDAKAEDAEKGGEENEGESEEKKASRVTAQDEDDEEEAEEAEEEAEEAEEEAEEAEKEAEEAEKKAALIIKAARLKIKKLEAKVKLLEAKEDQDSDDDEVEDDDGEEDDSSGSEKTSAELDIELGADSGDDVNLDQELTAALDSEDDDELLPDPNDSVLAAALLGEDDTPDDDDDVSGGSAEASKSGSRKASKRTKRGIKSLGGSARLASERDGDVQELSGIWEDVPDLSELW